MKAIPLRYSRPKHASTIFFFFFKDKKNDVIFSDVLDLVYVTDHLRVISSDASL